MDKMDNRYQEITELAKKMELDFFPIIYHTVDFETMTNVCSYGLPVRARHWSYGRSYDHHKLYGEMGFSKIYEVIFNNNPSHAFMLDTNTDEAKMLVTAHCAGHCLDPETMVETNNGPKSLKEIDVKKDKVLTHKGNYEKIIAKSFTQHSGKFVKMKVQGYGEIISTDYHPFLTVKSDECSLAYRKSICKENCVYKQQNQCNDKPYQRYESNFLKASELSEKDFVVFPKPKYFGTNKKEYIEIAGSKILHRQNINLKYRLPIGLNLGKFIGLYLSEGYSRELGQMGLCFNSNEDNLHNTSQELVNNLFNLRTYKHTVEEQHSTQVNFNEIILSKWLLEKFGNSCYTKYIDLEILKQANDEFLKGILWGTFSGDGDNWQRASHLKTTSIRLASQIRDICYYFGIICGISEKHNKDRNISYIVTISGVNQKKFIDLTSIDWVLDDKNRNYEFGWQDEDKIYLPIQKIEHYEDTKEVCNLQVDVDSSFVLTNGATTHNSDFFKNNYLFQGTNRNMVHHAADHASRVDDYIDKYGLEKVERIMDIALSLNDHIDPFKGLYRKPYGKKVILKTSNFINEDDRLRGIGKNINRTKKQVLNNTFPPHPEKDLLWFFIHHAPLEEWEADVLDIIREESYYFYPQMMTKIMNEGWASFWHAEILYQYENITPEEHMNFARLHEKVVQAGGNPYRINPYYLGFRIFKDIEKRWDELYKNGKSKITGREKIFQVRAEEDDVSFLRNYLTADLVEELGLFIYGRATEFENKSQYKDVVIRSRMRDDVVEQLIKPICTRGVPEIAIVQASSEKICLKHLNPDIGTIDFKYAEKTLEFIFELWAAPVELFVTDDNGDPVTLRYDVLGFNIVKSEDDLDFLEEEEEEDE